MRERERRFGILRVVILLFMVSACCGYASDLFAGPIATDSAAIAGWHGTQSFNASGQLLVDMDYAVYLPGQYSGSDPSGGSDYVYAYQALVTPSSTVGLGDLSVGLVLGSNARHEASDATYGQTPGTAPADISLSQDDSCIWTYFSPLAPNHWSTVLLFTSPYPPTMSSAGIANGGYSNQQNLPTPLPEPATLTLLICGFAAISKFFRKLS